MQPKFIQISRNIVPFLVISLFAIVCLQHEAFAQKKKKRKKKQKEEQVASKNQMSQEMYILNTRSGNVEAQEAHISQMRKRKGKISIAERRNKFVEERRKERKRLMEEFKKPQYSDPMFFGHKKKPKKRPVGKQKLCKVCGIYH